MPKFMVIHDLPNPVSVPEGEGVAKATKVLSNADCYWIGSTLQLEPDGKIRRIICQYDAKDIGSVNKLLDQIRKQIPGFPIDGPYPMVWVDGESYR
jgi:hypothetical protein